MTAQPTVTAVIPTRNRPDLVLRAVESVRRQTLGAVEIVVVVDGPDPATMATLSKVDDPRLRVVEHQESRGASAARNTGVQEATGTWVGFLDDDDEWLPNKLERQLATLANATAPTIGLARVIVRSPKADYVWPRRGPRPDEPVSEYLFVRRSLFAGEGKVQTSMLMAQRSLALAVPFQEGLTRYQEADWVLRATATGAELRYTDEPLAIWHVDEGRETVTSRHAGNWRLTVDWVNDRRALITPRAYAAFMLIRVSSTAAEAGDVRGLLMAWRLAWRHGRPGPIDVLLFLGKAILPPTLRSTVRRRLSGQRPTTETTS